MSSPALAVRARVRYQFAAAAEDVFDAWIDPAKIRLWFAPGLGEMRQVDIDPRVGGTFCIVQRRAEGDASHAGEYLELERPRRLAFTWTTPPQADQSRVRIEIAGTADGCELTLLHDMEPQWASHVDKVEHGWAMMLGAMARMLDARPDVP